MAWESHLQSFKLYQTLSSPFIRLQFLNAAFDLNLSLPEVEATDNAYQSFFERYNTICKVGMSASGTIRSTTHWHIVEIISLLKSNKTRQYITLAIQNLVINLSPESSVVLIDIAASAWSMHTINNLPGAISDENPINWETGHLSLDLSLQHPPIKREKDIVKLPQSFTAANVEKIGGISIRWTENLADHLELRDDDTKVMIFHHVSALRLLQDSKSSGLPLGLAEETIRTISLLLPPVLGQPNPWFKKELKKINRHIDINAGNCSRLNSSQRRIDEFLFWSNRLVLLKRTFDEAEPRSIHQLWWDDRRKTQWFTFWVAVLVFALTLFFGVVQSVASIVQAWASVKALHQ